MEYIVIAGTFGGFLVVCNLSQTIWRQLSGIAEFIKSKLHSAITARQRKETGLKNLMNLNPEYLKTLQYLHAKNIKRFPDDKYNATLSGMVIYCLLERDDPPGDEKHSKTHYIVPDYIWNEISKLLPENKSRTPNEPPWASRRYPP